MNDDKLSVTELNILIHLQQKERVTREQLINITGLDDRTNRYIINVMRKKNVPIISSSCEKGYRLAYNENDCKNFANEIVHKAQDEMKIANGVLSDKAMKYYKCKV